MKIKILKDCLTTVDNFTLRQFYKNETVDVRESCAVRLIQRGSAVAVSEHFIYKAGQESERCEFCGYVPAWCSCDPEEPESP